MSRVEPARRAPRGAPARQAGTAAGVNRSVIAVPFACLLWRRPLAADATSSAAGAGALAAVVGSP